MSRCGSGGKRGRRGTEGDAVPRVGEHERERMGDEGSESEMHEGGRESATMRESRDRDAVTRKARTGRGASESIAFRNPEKERAARREERTKKERRRRRNASALSTWATRRKKEDGNRIREGWREREENERGWLQE